MMKLFGRVMLAAMLAVGMWMMAGCEDHTIAGELVDEFKGDDSDNGGASQTQLPVSESSPHRSSVSAKDVSGTWKGRAGTGQGPTTLRLTQNGSSLSGSWTWGAKDTRSCSGYRDGSTVHLKDKRSDGDSWTMTISADGSRMNGSAKKYGGGGYALSFSR